MKIDILDATHFLALVWDRVSVETTQKHFSKCGIGRLGLPGEVSVTEGDPPPPQSGTSSNRTVLLRTTYLQTSLATSAMLSLENVIRDVQSV